MPSRWDVAEDALLACADDDLRVEGEVVPALMAFAGDALRFVAWVRPFEPGAYHEPLRELLPLAAALACDGLVLSIAGRAWSLDDPVPPVSADGDLRQRVLVLHVVDGSADPPRTRSVLHPFALDADGVAWDERCPMDEAPQGWITRAMEGAVSLRDVRRAPPEEVATLARRAAELGHVLHVTSDVQALLAPHATADDP